MKLRLFLVPAVCFSLLAFSAVSTRSQTVVTFDDLHETGSGAWIWNTHQGYAGLIWSNILCNNAILFTNIVPRFPGSPTNGLTGDYYGMISPSNVVEMFSGCEIDSPATNFNFLSAYLTGGWNNNLNIEVQGYRDTNLVYDETKVASATSPTLFTFDYLEINRLYFTCYGGDPAFGVSGGDYVFVMDNMTIEFIPEPSSLLLTGIGVVMLWTIGRRRRR